MVKGGGGRVGENFMGGSCPGGKCPDTVLNNLVFRLKKLILTHGKMKIRSCQRQIQEHCNI